MILYDKGKFYYVKNVQNKKDYCRNFNIISTLKIRIEKYHMANLLKKNKYLVIKYKWNPGTKKQICRFYNLNGFRFFFFFQLISSKNYFLFKKDIIFFDYNDSFKSIYKRMFSHIMRPPFVTFSSTLFGYLDGYFPTPNYGFFRYICETSGLILQSNYFRYSTVYGRVEIFFKFYRLIDEKKFKIFFFQKFKVYAFSSWYTKLVFIKVVNHNIREKTIYLRARNCEDRKYLSRN